MIPSFLRGSAALLVAIAAYVLSIRSEPTSVTGANVASLKRPKRGVPRATLINVPKASTSIAEALDFDSLMGHSGDLRVRILESGEADSYPSLDRRFGGALRAPGTRTFPLGTGETNFSFVTLTPWSRKLGDYINGYYVGLWPAELRRMPDAYANPSGFLEVTRDNVDLQVSKHFRLRDFITHDQQHVWPKYLVLREELLDKLELVLTSLESFGVGTQNVVVLSGFRSPQYNARGVGEGMARASRHQFGDAADIIVDANRDGRMDDLNGDGRVNYDDLSVLDRAVQLIERQYPELVGGLGLYHEMGPSGPFAHIDVRGTRARWTNSRPRNRTSVWATGYAPNGIAHSSGKCIADGAMAVLCAGVR